MRYFDLPPVYLILCLCLAYWLGQLVPMPVGGALALLGEGLFYAGLALILAAGWEFLKARTSIIPRAAPKGLITGGIYRVTRNPIYLADTLILSGLALRWQAPLALLLVPLFVWWITRHFIRQEEATLTRAFPETYPGYVSRVRRWI